MISARSNSLILTWQSFRPSGARFCESRLSALFTKYHYFFGQSYSNHLRVNGSDCKDKGIKKLYSFVLCINHFLEEKFLKDIENKNKISVTVMGLIILLRLTHLVKSSIKTLICS